MSSKEHNLSDNKCGEFDKQSWAAGVILKVGTDIIAIYTLWLLVILFQHRKQIMVHIPLLYQNLPLRDHPLRLKLAARLPQLQTSMSGDGSD